MHVPKFGSIVSEWDERNVIGEIIVEILCASLCHNGWLFFFPSQWGESILCTQFFMWKSMQSHAVDCMLWYYCVMCTYCTIWLSSYLQSHFNLICMMCVLCVCVCGGTRSDVLCSGFSVSNDTKILYPISWYQCW